MRDFTSGIVKIYIGVAARVDALQGRNFAGTLVCLYECVDAISGHKHWCTASVIIAAAAAVEALWFAN